MFLFGLFTLAVAEVVVYLAFGKKIQAWLLERWTR